MDQQATRPRTHSDYTVGWVCALPKEQTAAIAMLDHRHPELPRPPNDQNAYTLGSIGGHHIVIACLPKGKIGTNSAATVATRITQTFPSIKVGLMVGIGGGIPPEVRLGDVVIGTPTAEYPGVVQWDLGKAEDGGNFTRTGSLNNPPSFLLTALTKMESEVSMYGSKIQQYLDEALEKFPRLAPKSMRPASLEDASTKGDDSQKPPGECEVHYGLIASGNKVIKDATVRDKINSDLGGNVLCVEMEAAGLLDYPSIVIRGICDYADSEKNKDWQEHASAVAAACAKEFLGYLQPSDIGNQRPISETLGQLLENVDSLSVKARTDEEEKILTWITPFNYGEQHTDILKRQQPGTCQWVLDSDEYHDWVDTPKGILLCPGIPGAGKTIVTSVVVNDLIQKFGEQCDTGIAYIYCSHQQKNQQTIDDLIASILKQLATRQAALPSDVTELYRRHKYKGTRPLLEEYLSALHSVSALYTKIFIIVDALDEFQEDNGRRTEFLRELFNLRDKCGAHVFATSRFIPDIVDQFRGSLTLEIRANTDDIKKYLEENMTDLSIAMSQGCQLWDEIVNEITDAASGMFLLAKLYLGSVSEKVSPNDVRETLKGFQRQGREPTDKSTDEILNSAYEQTMNRISTQSGEFKKLAFNVLSWITCAKTRLNTWELRHALATRSRQSKLDPGDFIQLQLILRVCAGLVIVDEESDIVRLAHRTTEVYFDRRKGDLFPQCEAKITRACIAYLSFSTFEDGYCQTPAELERRLDSHKFYEYASHNWGHHAREAKPFSTDIRHFLHHEMKVKASSQALMISNKSPGYLGLRYIRTSQMFPNGFTALHLAAYFGLEELVMALLETYHPSSRDMYGNTPLMYGAAYGRNAVVKLLLSIDQTQLDAESRDYVPIEPLERTPLSIAAQKRHGGVVELLLGHPSVNPNLDFGFDHPTPLSFAAENGHAEIVERLLGHPNINPNLSDEKYRTPLSLAAEVGHTEVVKLLLGHPDIDLHISNRNNRTPLSFAAENGHTEVAKLLLGHPDMDRDPLRYNNYIPLKWATISGHITVFDLLLEKERSRAKFNTCYIQQALLWSVHNEEIALVKSLLTCKHAGTSLLFRYYQTSLWWAAASQNPDLVELFFACGYVKRGFKDEDDFDMCGTKKHVKLPRNILLDLENVDLESKNGRGQTPLHWATEFGQKDVVKSILRTDVDLNRKDFNGRTPLITAAICGNSEITEHLLAQDGIDPNAGDNTGMNPLLVGAYNGHESIVRLLLAKDGVDVNATDIWGQTPLTAADFNGHESIVTLLLAKEGVANAAHDTYQTPYYMVGDGEHNSTATLLGVNGGVDLRFQSVSVFAPPDRISAKHLRDESGVDARRLRHKPERDNL